MKSILKMIQEALTNNWMLKIFAFIIASIVWLAVINVNDPTKTVTIYNVPINLTNEDVITSNNQIYSVKGSQTVNITVTGRRSVVSSLNASSFRVEASMEELSLTNSIPVTITVKNSSIAGKVTISKQSVTQIAVDIENIETRTYAVEENVTGEVSKNYELGEVKLVRNQVAVTAPDSIHDRIEKVVVNVDVDGVTSDFTDKYKVVLLDSLGNKIAKNDTVKLSKSKIQVSVKVFKVVKVPLVIKTTGKLPDGYDLINVSTDMEEVTIAGPSDIVSGIKEIEITGEDTDLTGITGNTDRKIDLINYLIPGVYIRGTSEVTLSISIESDVSKTFTLKPSDITLANLSDDYDAEITSSDVEIVLSGKEREFEGVTKDTFKAHVDLKGLKEGKEKVELELSIPEGLELVKSGSVKVKIVKKEQVIGESNE